jgi:heptosyltransferase-2
VERILIVAPSWVGDAILSEPLIALLRERPDAPEIDVLAPPWCGPVYARMHGVREVIANPIPHGRFDLAGRRHLARILRGHSGREGYAEAFVLPNSWKSALVPWLARIPRRVGYLGESRWGLLTDARPLARKAVPRLVDRFAALAFPRDAPPPASPRPVLVPDRANRDAAKNAPAWTPPRRGGVLSRAPVRPGQALAGRALATPARRFVAEGGRSG